MPPAGCNLPLHSGRCCLFSQPLLQSGMPVVVIEDVEHFDYQVVTELVKELYSVEVFQMDPRDFGMPVSRRRLYVVLFLKSHGQVDP